MAAEAFADPKKAEEAFGFDVRGAGFLPVQVIFDNEGTHLLKIVPEQTFLEDGKGNLWPILDRTRPPITGYEIFPDQADLQRGELWGLLGAAAAAIAVCHRIVAGRKKKRREGWSRQLEKGRRWEALPEEPLVGPKVSPLQDEAPRTIMADLNRKSLENKPISRGLGLWFSFLPGEAKSARN